MISVRQALDAAWQHYRRGEWQQAESLYLRVLEADPDQVDALHLLGAIAGQTGRADQAIGYLRRVLRLRPDWAAAHNNLGNALAAQKRFSEAVASFQEAVRLQPDFAVAHNNLGNALRESGRLAEAEASFQRSWGLRPDEAPVPPNTGNAPLGKGQAAQNTEPSPQVARPEDADAEAHFRRGSPWGSRGETRRRRPACGRPSALSRTTPRRTSTWESPS